MPPICIAATQAIGEKSIALLASRAKPFVSMLPCDHSGLFPKFL